MSTTDRVGDASMRTRIWQLTAFSCGTLVVLGLLLVWSLERTRQANVWVDHTQTVLRELTVYDQDLVDAETGQRGYLLTQREEYLWPYDKGLADGPARLTRLRYLITDGGERRKLDQLSTIFGRKTDELALTIRLARGGALQAALAIVRQGRGRAYMVDFRRVSGQIGDAEAGLLMHRQAVAAAEDRNIQIAIVGGGLLAILLIVAATRMTLGRIEDRSRLLMRAIHAVAGGRLDRRIASDSRDGIGKIAQAFNGMADRLQEANQSRVAIEADLAASNGQLVVEVAERTAAQSRLSRIVTELKRSNEELDNFAYGASHDLKAPLRGIRNLAEWIAADVQATAGEDTMQNLALLRSRVERLDLLLNSLLQYSRVGRSGGAPEEIDICALVRDIGDYIAPRAGFAVTCSGEFPGFHGDKAPLEQVLRNLIGNGLKHHDRDAGSVAVSVRDLGDKIEIRVADDGPGIGPAFHERVFQMFQTLKSRDEIEGSGMGLAIVKKSVEGHGGTIRIESTPPDRGAAFVFTWEKNRQALAA